MPRIKKTSTTESDVVTPATDDKPNVTPEPVESKPVAAESDVVTKPRSVGATTMATQASFGKLFPGGNPCEIRVADDRGDYSLTCQSHEAAIKSVKNIIARLRTYARVGSPYAVDGVYVTTANYLHVPNGKNAVAEAVIVVRTLNGDIELPVADLETAQKKAEHCAICMTTGRVFEISLENGDHAVVRALAVTVREV